MCNLQIRKFFSSTSHGGSLACKDIHPAAQAADSIMGMNVQPTDSQVFFLYFPPWQPNYKA